jgi:hypothetical protein
MTIVTSPRCYKAVTFSVSMPFQCLLLCRDAERITALRQALSRLDIEAVLCGEAHAAQELLNKKKFEAAIIDLHLLNSHLVLQGFRDQPDRKIIVAAILSPEDTVRGAFDEGANFVFYTPLSLERAMQGLRAVKNLMYPQRRQQFRKSLHMAVEVSLDGIHYVKSVLLNLSEGGVSIRMPEKVKITEKVHLRFFLPDSKISIETVGEITWADKNGRAGIRFVKLSKEHQRHVQNWLNPTGQATQTNR